jgi:hypothetical protein
MSCAGEALRAPARAGKRLALSIAAPEVSAKGAASSDVSLGIVRAAGVTLESLIEHAAHVCRR